MDRNSMRPRRLLEILIHLITWGIVFGFPLFFSAHREGGGVSAMNYVRHLCIPVAFAIVFYVNFLVLVPRLLLQNRRNRYILLNVALLIGVAVMIRVWQNLTVDPSRLMPPHGIPRGWIFFVRDILSLILTVMLSAAIRMSMQWSKEQTARREAERQRAEAELKNLRNQLNPHFLLNTLNNIYALIAFDSEKAQEAVRELSRLLRYVLYDNRDDRVPLCKEIDFLRSYIELMRIRTSTHVDITTRFDTDPESRTPIAPLIFISLIENAFKHGISPIEKSFIRIELKETREEVVCRIANSNFPKSADRDKSGSGIGLEQVSRRLEMLYPGSYTWTHGTTDDGKVYESELCIVKPKHIAS